MARIFLSYSRSDAEKVEPLARALESEGYSVWWDRRIKGGSEFDAVIEKALNEADFVLVAWSKIASRSAWVRDEAAAGRDRQCLVPLTLDGSVPPLGFRQFQTIDFSRWNARGRSPELEELLDALATAEGNERGGKAGIDGRNVERRLRFPRSAAFVALIALLVVVGFGWWWIARGSTAPILVTIEAANGSDKSQEVARDLAAQLGDLQPGGGGAFQLTPNKSRANLFLQINASDENKKLRRELSLVSDDSILWSTTLVFEGDYPDELAQDLPRIAGQVLTCAAQARRAQLEPTTFKLHVRGCAQLEDYMGLGNYDTPAAKLFQEVVRRAPDFQAGWANLLWTTTSATDLRQLIAQVEQLKHAPGELYEAKARLLPAQDFLEKLSLIEKGIAADPDSARLHASHAKKLVSVGRARDAVAAAARALQLDPISLDSQQTYVSVLEDAGEVEQLHAQLLKRSTKWPRSSLVQSEIFQFHANYGDAKRALAMYRDGEFVFPEKEQENLILARINPTSEAIRRAIDSAKARYVRDPNYATTLLLVLGRFGRAEEAIRLMLRYTGPTTILSGRLFQPAMRDVWRDPRSMAAAARLGLLRYWQGSGHWPDFCQAPDLPFDCKKVAAKHNANAFLRLRPAGR